MEQQWLPAVKPWHALERHAADVVAWIAPAGPAAHFAFEEWLHGQIRNPLTRKAYLRAVRRFVQWCQQRSLEVIRVTPADVGRHLDLKQANPEGFWSDLLRGRGAQPRAGAGEARG